MPFSFPTLNHCVSTPHISASAVAGLVEIAPFLLVMPFPQESAAPPPQVYCMPGGQGLMFQPNIACMSFKNTRVILE